MSIESTPSDADEVAHVIANSASRLFQKIGLIGKTPARTQETQLPWNVAAWSEVIDAGFEFAMLREELGGVGALHALTILQLAGAQAVPLPLAETIGANWLLSAAGLEPDSGPLTFADGDLDLASDGPEWHIRGSLLQVPWARICDIVCVGRKSGVPHLLRIDRDVAMISEGSNVAGEPRHRCVFDAKLPADRVARLPDNFHPSTTRRLGAALRAAQMAGAISTVLDMSLSYTQSRRQFGRPLAAFQAIQQLIAVMASQAAAAGVACGLAAGAIANGLEPLAIAAAKVRIGEAASAVAAIAHQVHGAMGFSSEYPLHLLTRRLWAWRDEFGGEAEWSIELGRALIGNGKSDLWTSLTAIAKD
jgi:acyl-CoA dehydrogenase